eukprot:Seg4902.2 transcript_id=Seg4902.2/GoldUCD/mRNA.D3Y31 product="Sulfotransferase 1C4" protein_id=Seg4902.2/GoldUCD/D3Y31
MAHIKTIPFSDEETERLKKLYTSVRDLGQRFIRTDPGNCALPAAYEKYKSRFKDWELRADDVYVFAFAKNGTTWTQELVWCVQNDCDIEKAKSMPLMQRVPFMDMPMIADFMPKDKMPDMPQLQGDMLARMEKMPSPRMLKSHLPFYLLPDDLLDKCKVVLCIRNPKDTVVSYFHHEKLIKVHGFDGDFESYFNLFMDDMSMYCSYFDYVTEAWKRRDHPNLCLLKFEDMKKDQASSVRKVAKFLGKDLSDEQVEILVEHLSFKKMKENRAVNGEDMRGKAFAMKGDFIRKGQVGDWKNYLTDEMNKKMDAAIEKYLKPVGLEFVYEL